MCGEKEGAAGDSESAFEGRDPWEHSYASHSFCCLQLDYSGHFADFFLISVGVRTQALGLFGLLHCYCPLRAGCVLRLAKLTRAGPISIVPQQRKKPPLASIRKDHKV